jgi:hypothetical protein
MPGSPCLSSNADRATYPGLRLQQVRQVQQGPIDLQPDGSLSLDPRKVSMTILLLALSVKASSLDPLPWEAPFSWPTEVEIRTWTLEAAVGKKSSHDATLRRSSRLSGQAVATGVDLPKEEIPDASVCCHSRSFS